MGFEAISYTQIKAPSEMIDRILNIHLISLYNFSSNFDFSNLDQPHRIDFDMNYYLFFRDTSLFIFL